MSRLVYVAPLALAGCFASNGDQGMFVLNNSAPTMGSTTCMFSGTLMQPIQPAGTINIASTNPYIMSPLMASRITATMGQEIQRTIFVQGAKVTLDVESTSLAPMGGGAPSHPTIMLSGTDAQFEALAGGNLAPNQGTANIPFGLVPVTALQSIASQANAGTGTLNVELKAHIVMFGQFAGSRIEADPFDYGITVCNNCVVVNYGMCPLPSSVTTHANPCNPFQDGTLACCTNATGPATCQ